MHQMWIRKQELLRQGKSVFPGWNTGSEDASNSEGAFSFTETQAALDDIAQAGVSHNVGPTSGARPKDGTYPNPTVAVPPSGGSSNKANWKVMADSDDDYDDGFDDDLELYCDDDYNDKPDSPPPPTVIRKLEPRNVTSSQENTDWGNWKPVTNSDPPPKPLLHNTPPADSSSLYCPPSTSSPDSIDYNRQIVGVAGVPILVEALQEGIFQNVTIFYVCSTCGKVFWEGKHFERILTQFREVFVDGKDRNLPGNKILSSYQSVLSLE